MNHHLEQRFPDASDAIEDLANRDGRFASVITDYEELCTWFVIARRSASSDEVESARELIVELEKEIRKQLEEYHEHTR